MRRRTGPLPRIACMPCEFTEQVSEVRVVLERRETGLGEALDARLDPAEDALADGQSLHFDEVVDGFERDAVADVFCNQRVSKKHADEVESDGRTSLCEREDDVENVAKQAVGL